MTVKIQLFDGVELPKNPVIVEAFPGKGYVSTIAAGQIINTLEMELIGWIKSDITAGITVIHDGVPLRPIQIYRKDSLILIYSEAVIPFENIREFSTAFKEWFATIEPSRIILLAGVTGSKQESEHTIFSVCNDKDCKKLLDDLSVPHLQEGMVVGVASELMHWCRHHDIPYVSLMAETVITPDPTAAATLLNIINKVLDIKVPTEQLTEVGDAIEAKMTEIMDSIKRGKDGYKQIEADSPMYG